MGSEACAARAMAEVSEQMLPLCVRDVLEAARDVRPHIDVTCISFHLKAIEQVPHVGVSVKVEVLKRVAVAREE